MSQRSRQAGALLLLMGLFSYGQASAMHIMEGFLPMEECIFWFVLTLPVVGYGFYKINKEISSYPDRKMLLALAAAFIFVLSALKIPSVTGSSSHPTGVGLAAILFGPAIASALAIIVLIFQSLLLAHGGITTLGANTFSMGVAGGVIAWAVYKTLKGSSNGSDKWAVFFAAALADLGTYVVTSGQLAFAYPDPIGGFAASFTKFATIFAITQIPLAIIEGILAVVVYNTLLYYGEQGLIPLWWRKDKGGKENE